MSSLRESRANRNRPCRICGEANEWCLHLDRIDGMICMKVEAPGAKIHKFKDGSIGYLYKFGESPPRPIPPLKEEKTVINTPLAALPHRDSVYRTLLEYCFYNLSDAQCIHLTKDRMIPMEQLSSFGFLPEDLEWRDMICRDVFKDTNLSGVPGFFQKFYGVWTIGGPSGILVPYFSREGLIQGFQIRIEGAVKNKYRWLSTNPEDFNMGTASGTHLNFTRHTHHDQIWLCEGGLKAIVASNLSGKMFIGLPGAHVSHVDLLQKLAKGWGCEFILCPDVDFRENQHVYRHWFNNILVMTNIARTRVATWPPEDGKGIDDYLMKTKRLPKILSTKKWLEMFPPPEGLKELLMVG